MTDTSSDPAAESPSGADALPTEPPPAEPEEEAEVPLDADSSVDTPEDPADSRGEPVPSDEPNILLPRDGPHDTRERDALDQAAAANPFEDTTLSDADSVEPGDLTADETETDEPSPAPDSEPSAETV